MLNSDRNLTLLFLDFDRFEIVNESLGHETGDQLLVNDVSLHRFPVDFLKFDRSFIKDIDKNRNLASMVNSISVLARNLGIVTVAEGIETPEQFVAIRELGCDLAQGYLIAKPLSAEDFVDFARIREPKVPTSTGADVFKGRWENSIALMT